MSTFWLHLSKQNFKFSAAHFLIFDEKSAERLHGHNYQVKVNMQVENEESLKKTGYLIDFKFLKKEICRRLEEWDECVLLPQKNVEMKIITESPLHNGRVLEVYFRDRYYVFPKNEVVLLPINNTSVENLALLLAQDFKKIFKKQGLKKIQVVVMETSGQSASVIL